MTKFQNTLATLLYFTSFLSQVTVQAQIPASVQATVRNLAASSHDFKTQLGPLTSMEFSASGQRLAAVSEDGTFAVWNLSGERQTEIKAPGWKSTDVHWSPDDQYILTRQIPDSRDNVLLETPDETDRGPHESEERIAIWNAQDGALEQEWMLPAAAITAMRWVDTRTLAIAGTRSKGPFVQWRSFPEGDVQKELPIYATVIAPGATRFAAVQVNQKFERTIVVSTPRANGSIQVQKASLKTLLTEEIAFSADGSRLYVITNDNFKVYEYQTDPLRFTRSFSFGSNPLSHLLLPDAPILVTIGTDRRQVYDAMTGTYLGDVDGTQIGAISRDGQHLAFATFGGENQQGTQRGDSQSAVRLLTLRADLALPSQLTEAVELPLWGASVVALDFQGHDQIALALRLGPHFARDIDELLGWNLSQRRNTPVFDLKSGLRGQGDDYKLPIALAPNGRRIVVRTPSETWSNTPY